MPMTDFAAGTVQRRAQGTDYLTGVAAESVMGTVSSCIRSVPLLGHGRAGLGRSGLAPMARDSWACVVGGGLVGGRLV